ncbi:hypothetical protein [Blastococcus sp. PRF04-17]|uniref:hypothetical protein n=1 Tax=Blastococcus sp. PRF04-17 TaxID=2933797 RepID=UPI001FF519D7|nr:hypothetical protein [Blastococcus sp. PRF04-17]UOY02460.1 hypothetical protein MVA48_03465 [Blastococcus sp. PRF04-17]
MRPTPAPAHVPMGSDHHAVTVQQCRTATTHHPDQRGQQPGGEVVQPGPGHQALHGLVEVRLVGLPP